MLNNVHLFNLLRVLYLCVNKTIHTYEDTNTGEQLNDYIHVYIQINCNIKFSGLFGRAHFKFSASCFGVFSGFFLWEGGSGSTVNRPNTLWLLICFYFIWCMAALGLIFHRLLYFTEHDVVTLLNSSILTVKTIIEV